MLRSGLDRAFVRYARTGDPGALARVFDGSAQELYRLGFHLLGDRHAAEDLVQHTFVVAIEQATSFDGSRRVLPWLCGILTNRALHLRRQARQRDASGERRDTAERAVDPAEQAAAREAEAVVAAAVRSLDEPYRQVLLLHLVHELAPKDIAEALARPDATVRTQLARGLELLRKALPLGIAGLAAGQVPPALQLGAVRGAVLSRAAQVAATAAASASGVVVFTGVVAMKKMLLLLAAVLAAFLAWPWIASAEPVPVVGAGASSRAATPVVGPAPAASPSDATAAAERVEAPDAIDASSASLLVRVSWSDGTPAADVPVRVRPRPLDVERWVRVERTGDDGVARFLRLPPGALNALTNRGASADVELTAGSTANATIALPRTLDVRGRVVDLDGRPFAGATVWMSIWRNSDDGEPVAISGADGSFLIRDAGPWHLLAATAPGFATANVQSVRQPDVVLSMRPAAGTIVGTVVDPHGRPVAGARVLLGVTFGANLNERGVHTREFWGLDGRDMWPSRYLRTDDDGHFRSEGLPPGMRWPLWVGAQQFAPAFCEVDVRADAETAVTVQLVRGATLHGRIADAAGAGIAGARVWAYCELPEPHPLLGPQLSGSAPPAWAKLSTKTDANGCYELTRVRPAQYTLRAWHRFAGAAETDDFSATATHEFADGETFEWNAVVEPKTNQPLHGVLVDEVGNPLERWVVRVEEDPYNPDGIDVGAGGSFRTYRVPPGRRRISVRPREPMFGAAFDAGEFDVASCPLRIVVPRAFVPTSRLRGRVVPPAGIAASSTGRWLVRVMPADPRYLLQLRCDADGKYEAGPLERGRYRLTVVSRVFGEAPMGAIEVVDGRDTDAGTFQPPVPGTLVVTVVDPQGKRRPDAWVTAQLVGRDEHLAPARDPRASNHLDHRDGVARGNVVPGRWRVATRDFAVMAAIEVDVRAGETTDVRFAVPDGVPFVLRVPAAARARGRMAVRWLGADGTLLREHILYEDDVGRDEPMLAAAGRYTLEVIDWRGTKTSATFDLRASDPPQVVELPLQ